MIKRRSLPFMLSFVAPTFRKLTSSSKLQKTYLKNIYIDFFLSLRADGIFQILQSDWFRERAVFCDLARQPGRNRWQLFVVCEWAKPVIFNHFSVKTCAIFSVIAREKCILLFIPGQFGHTWLNKRNELVSACTDIDMNMSKSVILAGAPSAAAVHYKILKL